MVSSKSPLPTDGLATASKQVVSSARRWATALCDVSLAPVVELMEQHRSTEPMLRPWLEATRTTQDWLLATWEQTASQMIDQGCAVLESARPSPPPRRSKPA